MKKKCVVTFFGLALSASIGLLSSCGSGSSGGGGNTLNPTPSIASVSPNSALQNSASFTLTVSGAGFISSSQVQFNGSSVTTTYQSATSLTAQVPGSTLSAAGSASVTVVNPAPGGGTSNAVTFTIGNPIPALSSISPNTATANAGNVTVTATGSNFNGNSVVEWNGSALSTTYISATELTALIPASDLSGSAAGTSAQVTVFNPTPNGGTSAALPFSTIATGTVVTTVSLPANHIVWDSTHGKLYASLPSSDTNGNSVVAIDPVTATVGTPHAAGSEPGPLALSADNSELYVGLWGSGQIKRFALPALTLDTSLNLQLSSAPSPNDVFTLAVSPSSSHTFSVLANNTTYIFDDATMRPNYLTASNTSDTALAWGANGSTLYANDGASTGHTLYVLSVDSSGLSIRNQYGYFAPSLFGSIHFDPVSGYVYEDGGGVSNQARGWVVNPANASVVGTFNLNSLVPYIAPRCVLDIPNGRVFYLGQTNDQLNHSSGLTIEAFDAKTYQLLGALSIPNATGVPNDFVRWGNAGLAFTTSDNSNGYSNTQPKPGPIYIVDGTFVKATGNPDVTSGTSVVTLPQLTAISPQTVTAGAGNTTLTVSGSNFSTAATVTWNGASLGTMVMSNSQLVATIPASDLATAGAGIVSVVDPGSTVAALNSLALTVLPTNTSLLAFNIAAADLAWDSQASQLMIPVSSGDPQYPNSILAFDPTSGAISKTASVPTDPDLARLTDDGSTLYVGFSVINSVSQLHLPNLNPVSSWSLGNDPSFGPYHVGDLEPAPGSPQTTAVSFALSGEAPPQSNGVTVYDSGVARPNGTARTIRALNMQWSSASLLYMAEEDDAAYSYTVDASGLTPQLSNSNWPATLVKLGKIHWDSGTSYLYDDNGLVINPATLTALGNLNSSGMVNQLVVPDSNLKRVFVLGQLPTQETTSNYTVQSFDATQLTALESITLNGLVGTPVAFVRWGSNGLAIATQNSSAGTDGGPAGMLYLLNDSSFVSANARRGGYKIQSEPRWPFEIWHKTNPY